MMGKGKGRDLILWVLIFAVVLVFWSSWKGERSEVRVIPYSEFKRYPNAGPRGIMEILCTGSVCLSVLATKACPDS